MACRGDLHECVARLIQRQQPRVLDVEPGAMQTQFPRLLQRRQARFAAQVSQALPHRFPRKIFGVIGAELLRRGPEAPRGRADQGNPAPERVIGRRRRELGLAALHEGAHAAAAAMAEHDDGADPQNGQGIVHGRPDTVMGPGLVERRNDVGDVGRRKSRPARPRKFPPA